MFIRNAEVCTEPQAQTFGRFFIENDVKKRCLILVLKHEALTRLEQKVFETNLVSCSPSAAARISNVPDLRYAARRGEGLL